MNPQTKKPHNKRTRTVVLAAAGVGGVAVVIVALIFLLGRGGPHAPALRSEPVYNNTREGFRFVAPEGWSQVAKADLPPGPVEKERLLVRYQAATGGGAMEVTIVD